jgi:hypothetical protein
MRRRILTSLFFTLVPTFCLAQNLPFPEPQPVTAAIAASQFDDRAKAVIETNACGREDDYLRIRNEMRDGNFNSQGEDLGHILIAKIAYIRTHSNAAVFVPCTTTIQRLRSDFDEHGRVTQILGTSACATETHENLVNHNDPNEAIPVNVAVSPQCMTEQVNEAIVNMKKTTQMGSSGLPCITDLKFIVEENGEFDVNVRELVRMLYLGGSSLQRRAPILAPRTVDYMYRNLLAAQGKLSDGSYSVLFGCIEPAGDRLGTPEDAADRHAWYRDLADALGDFFEWAVITYVTYAVPGAYPLIAAPFLLTAAVDGPANIIPSQFDIRVPESENHRLMIETSKFLINAAMIAHLEAENYDRVDDVRADQADVRDWLIERLQDIAKNDFQEYNARPYSRYSLNSVLNLHDFAAVHGDADLARAALIVLDLAEAKFAATSNRGRRVVPFRRLSDQDGDENSYLHESISGADHEIARSMLLSGQTQTVDKNLFNDLPNGGRKLALGTLAEMVNAATSSYRLPPPVLSTVIDRRVFEQSIRHTGVERVEQSPAFTISAGGVHTDPTGTVLGMGRDKDRGAAMPTVIIPTIAGSYMRDLFRFNGLGLHHERTANTCVTQGFACGFEPKLSVLFSGCTVKEVLPDSTSFFVNSGLCFPVSPGPHFYLAGRIVECPVAFCNTQWGVMDIVEAATPAAHGEPGNPLPDPAFNLFRAQRSAALSAISLDGSGRGTYTSAAGHTIVFGLAEGGLLSGTGNLATVVSIDGNPPPAFVTSGGVIDADGTGHATIKGPGVTVLIDFSDVSKPKRTP